jgi:hypothetical protein
LLRNVYNKNIYFSGNRVETSSVSVETNTLTTAASETVKLKDSARCLLDCLADGYYRQKRNREDHNRSELAERQSHVEAGSNTSTVALKVIGGDEKGSLESGRKPQMGALFQERLAN